MRHLYSFLVWFLDSLLVPWRGGRRAGVKQIIMSLVFQTIPTTFKNQTVFNSSLQYLPFRTGNLKQKLAEGRVENKQKNVGIHNVQWLIEYKIDGTFSWMSMMHGFKSMDNLLSICICQESEKKVGLSKRKNAFMTFSFHK